MNPGPDKSTMSSPADHPVPAEGRIDTEVRGHVLLIGINRPAQRNGWTVPMFRQLAEAYTRLDDEPGLRRFSALMKLEPFQRGMRELAPTVWFTALRRVQNPHRAALDVVGYDEQFGTLKISPFFEATDADLDAYLSAHDLPNEWDYHDPAKADEKRECGLHAAWGRRSSAA